MLNAAPLNKAAGATLRDRSNVAAVIVGGKVRAWQRNLPGADVPALIARIEASALGSSLRAGVERDLLG